MTALFGNLLALELKVMLTLGVVGTVLSTWMTALLLGAVLGGLLLWALLASRSFALSAAAVLDAAAPHSSAPT